MIQDNRKGYAVMNKELTAYKIDGCNIESLKEYCRNDDVIAERIPKHVGFKIRIIFIKWCKPIEFSKYLMSNILWFHWYVSKEYIHKTGKVVYGNIPG
jgi:hypothetical protein